MARISTYSLDEKITGGDKWIGSDSGFYNKTKNFTPLKLADYFNSSEKIDSTNSLRFWYQTLDFQEDRSFGTISFENEIGTSVSFSSITSFLLSKRTEGNIFVYDFLSSLIDSKVLLHQGNTMNLYAIYEVTNIEEYELDSNFIKVDVSFIRGNGSLIEDLSYLLSVVDFALEASLNWGNIEGNLSDQTDLQEALDLKVDISSLGDVAFSNDYNDLDNKPTIPNNLEELHNITETNYTTPIDTDSVLTFDITNSLWKRLSWSNIKSNLKTYFDTIYQATLGFTPENVANKATNLTSPDNTKYPTTQTVVDGLATKLDKSTTPSSVYGTDASGEQTMIPVSQFKDVLEFADLASFPATGETEKIYIALDTNLQYRWSGSAYVQIGGGSNYDLGNWIVDRFYKQASHIFIGGALNGGNNFGSTSVNVNSFKTFSGVGLQSGTNANGGYRYILENSVILASFEKLCFYSCFYMRNNTRDNIIRLGFFNTTANTAAVANGVYLQIDTNTATFNTANDNVATQQGSAILGSTLSPVIYYECLIEFLTTTSVRCKIKEILTGNVVLDETITTNIPASNRRFGAGITASITTAGTSSPIVSLQGMSFGIKPNFLNDF